MNSLNKRNRRLKAKRKHEQTRKKRRKIEAAKVYAYKFRGKEPLDSVETMVRNEMTRLVTPFGKNTA